MFKHNLGILERDYRKPLNIIDERAQYDPDDEPFDDLADEFVERYYSLIMRCGFLDGKITKEQYERVVPEIMRSD